MAEKVTENKNKLPSSLSGVAVEAPDLANEADEAFGQALDGVNDAEMEGKMMLVIDRLISSDLWPGVVEACEKAGGWRRGAKNAIFEALEKLNIHLTKDEEKVLLIVLRGRLGLPPPSEGPEKWLLEWDQVGPEIFRQFKDGYEIGERLMERYGNVAIQPTQDSSASETESKSKSSKSSPSVQALAGEGYSGSVREASVPDILSFSKEAPSWPDLQDSPKGYYERMKNFGDYLDLAKLQAKIAQEPKGYAEGIYNCLREFFGNLWKVKIPKEEKGKLAQGLKEYMNQFMGAALSVDGKVSGLRDFLVEDCSRQAVFENLSEIPEDIPPTLQRIIFTNSNKGVKTSKGVIRYLAWVFKTYSVEENHIASLANEDAINDHLLFTASQEVCDEISETWHTGAELPPGDSVIAKLEQEQKNNGDLPLDSHGMIPLEVLIQPGGMEAIMAKIQETDNGWSEFIAGRKATQKAEKEKLAQAEEIKLAEKKAQENISKAESPVEEQKVGIVAENEVLGNDDENHAPIKTIIPNSKPIVLGGGNDPFTEV